MAGPGDVGSSLLEFGVEKHSGRTFDEGAASTERKFYRSSLDERRSERQGVVAWRKWLSITNMSIGALEDLDSRGPPQPVHCPPQGLVL